MPKADRCSPSTLGPPPLFYNLSVLALAHIAMATATWLFFIGSIGSLIVIFISFAEDLHELLGKD